MIPPDLVAYHESRPLTLELAAEIHPERWQELGVSPIARERIIACSRARMGLSADLGWLLPSAADLPQVWDAKSHPCSEWALLPGTLLWKIGLRLGAARFQHEVDQLVWQTDVREFKEVAGVDAYHFALRQAPVLWRERLLPDEEVPAISLSLSVVQSAGIALGCWLAELPSPLAARVKLKLPPAADNDFALPCLWESSRRNMWLEPLATVVRTTTLTF